MATYTLDGLLVRETDDSRILGVESSSFSFIVPDFETDLLTTIREFTEEGEPLLNLVIADNDIRLGDRSIYDIAELDFAIATVDWNFGGEQGRSVVFNAFENETNFSHIFTIGGVPLPASAFETPAAVEAFLLSAEIAPPQFGSGFGPGEPIDLTALPDVIVNNSEFVVDNRNDSEPDRTYSLGIDDDTFRAGIGNDTVDGGDGFDTLQYEFTGGGIRANLTDAPREGLAPGEVQKLNGTDRVSSFENLLATNQSDRIFLPDGAGFVFNRAGDDYVEGDAGDTLFVSGSGEDTLIGGADDDVMIFEDDGFDGAGEAYQGIVLTMTGAGEGTVVDGWGFTDTFSGFARFEGGALDDIFVGAGGRDLFAGNLGADDMSGGGGNDTLLGGEGDDLLDGGLGRDVMEGGVGDDVYRVDDRRDVVVENSGEGIDRIEATSDVVLGSSEIEVVELSGGAVRVTGNGFATEMIGSDRGNILIGGGGGDTLEGGGGNDTFAFLIDDAAGAARIVDFEAGDRLALDDRFFGLGDAGIDVRAVTQQQISNAVRNGLVEYDGRSGALSIDADGRRGPEEAELVVTIEGGGRLGPDELLLF
ncbi:calcium-binding protein [Jannaschia seohaensis]|uniref:Ca2+-binding RTX toxin-like protein n=1 Tax=Jannaschia seohaensis TaxID=475081 RepID=A0A2Y9BC86_9RHOB|nr:hypothetical protein [Jannaschia seohaensis]PWJ09848.1 Ca2+-binding RTX toxin-like protein [Jannaschia seohaensis]SSA51929.1 Ca2+-binding protein, RTX toxin-related [Jannaschia seohaensis]